ncbi:PREDICTED: uncharacterized protein LOC109232630 [Nicotiana attenuata]|uniref:uncharacterized protein LOC109232630 n=1 Tax=Nicotiana attenuata TaxID=49451 RepID=UPI0009057FC5|nr:PREDICTED: uncharacterized protein LOC109232630 [Nicotiana attenuata]
MCKYHGTQGQKTKDCRQLREEVSRLFNEVHLREFLIDRSKNHFRDRDVNRKNEQEEPQHAIHMIVGGLDIPQGPVSKHTKVSITREKRTRDYGPEGSLSFNDEEAEGISQPHNDALVISILLNKVQVKHVLVDPGSSANIIRSRVLEQLGLQDQTVPTARVLNYFNMASETTKWETTLTVNVAGTIQDTKFHVIEGDMRYHALLGMPWIHKMRAVPRTFIVPEDSHVTKSTIEVLEQLILIEYLPERKVYLGMVLTPSSGKSLFSILAITWIFLLGPI